MRRGAGGSELIQYQVTQALKLHAHIHVVSAAIHSWKKWLKANLGQHVPKGSGLPILCPTGDSAVLSSWDG